MGWDPIDPTTEGGLWAYAQEFGGALPRYESDIVAAFDVVEQMRERGWDVSVSAWAAGVLKGWECVFHRAPKDAAGVLYEQRGKTASEAICRAALLAKWAEGISG